ncbi:hypothetical protein ACFV8Z_44130 [Streptomyces sp. NPDC059837]|uniref:hypothetical protein n=1 Tax=Streptomyces sp. NPDC059837 TaxID=3346968 RepID=UPI00365AF5E1
MQDCDAGTERYGEPMSGANVWLEQRTAEIRSMQLEIIALEVQPTDGTPVVRGAGVLGRTTGSTPCA